MAYVIIALGFGITFRILDRFLVICHLFICHWNEVPYVLYLCPLVRSTGRAGCLMLGWDVLAVIDLCTHEFMAKDGVLGGANMGHTLPAYLTE